jgi:coenzyme F420-0:L-glutamate ligase / coenzyme F420-1:gamma-L-glutamate ligase
MMDYHSLLELLRSRRSIRRFNKQPVDRDRLASLFEAARWAPSNHNRQPWKFLVLDDPRQIAALAEDMGRDLAEKLKSLPAVAAEFAADLCRHATFIADAPVLILALHKRPVSFSAKLLEDMPYPGLVSGEPLSTAMAVQNFVLAAQAMGLGTCVLTAPLLAPAAIARHFPLPPGYELNCLIALGYPLESPPAPRRKNLEHVVNYVNDRPQHHDDGK